MAAALLDVPPDGAPERAQASPLNEGLHSLLTNAEREILERALRECAGMTRSEVAARLRISERALHKKLKEHGIGSGRIRPVEMRGNI